MFFKIGFLKNFAILTGNTCLDSLFNKVAGTRVEGTSTQIFSCEYCKSFKNSFFHGPPPTAASEIRPVLKKIHDIYCIKQ